MSRDNLIKEGKDPASIYDTGNTAIDVLHLWSETIILTRERANEILGDCD
ncbi:hypothetical protein SDC9_59934 [bioreactor metagenome]|uniref:Uncharacterized protein n=1 Tax=bioreactor metagenome TaxID=1076179 RepID=A0A644XCF0_9ZZZZ